MSLVKVVSLDVFGTLIYPRIPVSVCYSQFAWESSQLYLSPDKVEKNFFIAYKEMTNSYPNFGKFTGMSSRKWWNKVIGRTYGLCLNRDFFDVGEKNTDRLYNWYSLEGAWHVYIGTFRALKRLQSYGIRIAALSNFDERLPMILKNLNLDEFFEKVIFSRDLPFWKPDPQIFQHICKECEIEPSNLLHCGDNVKKDYLAAKNVGAQAMLILPSSEVGSAAKFRDSVDGTPGLQKENIISNLDQLANIVIKNYYDHKNGVL